MSDTPHSIINYDATHTTVIRISEQNTVNQIYFPRQIQFQTLNNATTINSSLNVVGNIIGSGTALTNLNYNAITNPPAVVSFSNPGASISTLNISGNATLNNITTCRSLLLNVSGVTILSNNVVIGGSVANNISYHKLEMLDD